MAFGEREVIDIRWCCHRPSVRSALIALLVLALSGCAGTSVPRSPEGNSLIDRPAPFFTTETLEGEPFRLDEHRGKKLVVINFFGTWCPPCRAELPSLGRIYRENREDVLLFGVALNVEEENVRRFMRDLDLEFPVTLASRNLEEGITGRFNVPTVPTTVVVDSRGDVAYYKPGMLRKAHFRHLEKLIEKFNEPDSDGPFRSE